MANNFIEKKVTSTKEVVYSIGDACEIYDIEPYDIRNWEKRGLIKIDREDNGYRLIDICALQDIHRVSRLRRADVPYQSIKKIYDCDVDQMEKLFKKIVADAAKKLKKLQIGYKALSEEYDCIKQIKELEKTPLAFDTPDFKKAWYWDEHDLSLQQAWFKDAFSLDYTEPCPEGVKNSRTVVFVPNKYDMAPLKVLWEYNPQKTYVSYLSKSKHIKNGKYKYTIDTQARKQDRIDSYYMLINAGLKPLRALAPCLTRTYEYTYYKTFAECEILDAKKAAKLPTRPLAVSHVATPVDY